MKYLTQLGIVFLLLFFRASFASPIHIVAAENFYGNIAQALGGPHVQVKSLLQYGNQNPHFFSTSIQTAILLNQANIIIYNGLGYDTWITRLIPSQSHPCIKLAVAALASKKEGDNPHIWYDLQIMRLYTRTLADLLIQIDPEHKNDYKQRYVKLDQQYQQLAAQIHQLKQRYQNTPVTATEPLFNYMADALGLRMYGQGFQTHIMNDVEPTSEEVGNFESRLRQHKVKLLIYNYQVVSPMVRKMLAAAREENIPVLGVSEMLPPNMTYVAWMSRNLEELNTLLTASKAL